MDCKSSERSNIYSWTMFLLSHWSSDNLEHPIVLVSCKRIFSNHHYQIDINFQDNVKVAIRNGSFERDIPVCKARDYMRIKLYRDHVIYSLFHLVFYIYTTKRLAK